MTTQHFPPPLFNHGSTKEAYTFNNAIPVTVAAISVDSMQFLLRYLVDASFFILWLHVGFGSMILYRFYSGDWDNLSVWTSKPSNISNAETVSDLGTDFNVHHESWLGSSRTDHVGRMVHTFALMHVLIKLLLQLTRIPGMSRTIIPRPFKLAMFSYMNGQMNLKKIITLAEKEILTLTNMFHLNVRNIIGVFAII